MWLSLVSFFERWLGISVGDVTFDLPFTNGGSIDLVHLISIGVLAFALCWVLWFIKLIIDSIYRIF